jgi:hypothetical protein
LASVRKMAADLCSQIVFQNCVIRGEAPGTGNECAAIGRACLSPRVAGPFARSARQMPRDGSSGGIRVVDPHVGRGLFGRRPHPEKYQRWLRSITNGFWLLSLGVKSRSSSGGRQHWFHKRHLAPRRHETFGRSISTHLSPKYNPLFGPSPLNREKTRVGSAGRSAFEALQRVKIGSRRADGAQSISCGPASLRRRLKVEESVASPFR